MEEITMNCVNKQNTKINLFSLSEQMNSLVNENKITQELHDSLMKKTFTTRQEFYKLVERVKTIIERYK